MVSSKSRPKKICIGLLGYGTVGSNVYSLLENQADEITQATGASIEVKKILVRAASIPRPAAPV